MVINTTEIKTDIRNIVILFGLAVIVRWIAHLFVVDFVGTDEAMYGNIASNLIKSGKFSTDFLSYPWELLNSSLFFSSSGPSHLYHFQSPLYTLLIAVQFLLFGKSFASIQSINIVIGSLIIPVIYFLGKLLFNRRTGFLSGLITAIFPLTVFYSVAPSNTILAALFGPLALLFSLVFERNPDNKGKYLLFAGLFTGLAVQGRWVDGVVVLITVAIIAIYGLYKSPNRKNLLLVTLAGVLFAAICIPSAILNFIIFGNPIGLQLNSVAVSTAGSAIGSIMNYAELLLLINSIILIIGVAGIITFFRRSILWISVPLQVLLYSLTKAAPEQRFVLWIVPIITVYCAGFVLGEGAREKHIFAGIRLRSSRMHLITTVMFIAVLLFSFLPQYSFISLASTDSVGRSALFNYTQAYSWIENNIGPSEVIMARNPLFTFYTDRPTVMIHNNYNMSQIIDVVKFYKVHYLIIDEQASSNVELKSFYDNPNFVTEDRSAMISYIRGALIDASGSTEGWKISGGVPFVTVSSMNDSQQETATSLVMIVGSGIGSSTASIRYDFNNTVDFSHVNSLSFSMKTNGTNIERITIRLWDISQNRRWWNVELHGGEVWVSFSISPTAFTYQDTGFNISAVNSIVIEAKKSSSATPENFSLWLKNMNVETSELYLATLAFELDSPRLLILDVSPLWDT